jgi:hypothetical protein
VFWANITYTKEGKKAKTQADSAKMTGSKTALFRRPCVYAGCAASGGAARREFAACRRQNAAPAARQLFAASAGGKMPRLRRGKSCLPPAAAITAARQMHLPLRGT